ncbi:MAG: hypothetical protein U0353_02310 [Sandaracinus sp.]
MSEQGDGRETNDTRGAVVLRDVTTLSGHGKRLFGLLAAFNLFMFAPLVPSMGLGILFMGLPGALIAAGLVLLWGVIRITVERDAVVVQQGLRQRRLSLADIARVTVDPEPTERAYVMPATRDGQGNETFQVFGSHRMIEITLRSGQRVRVMSEAPHVVASAIEAARSAEANAASAATAAQVRVADPDDEARTGEEGQDVARARRAMGREGD